MQAYVNGITELQNILKSDDGTNKEAISKSIKALLDNDDYYEVFVDISPDIDHLLANKCEI